MYAWGRGDHGVLGIGAQAATPLPTPVLFGAELGLVRVKSVACSWVHSVRDARTRTGALWPLTVARWFTRHARPLHAPTTADGTGPGSLALRVAAGRLRGTVCALGLPYVFRTQVAVTDMGLMYTWGNGADGALGHGTTDSLSFPRLLDYFGLARPLFVQQAAAGSDVIGSHTLVVACPVNAPEQSQVRRRPCPRRQRVHARRCMRTTRVVHAARPPCGARLVVRAAANPPPA